MRAAVPVLLLVALAGCQHVFSASLDVAVSEEASDERVEISDLQNSEERMARDNCFGKAVRDQPEEKFNPTTSSVSEEMTHELETQSAKGEQPEDELTDARAELRAQAFNLGEEEEKSDETEELFDIEVLKHA
ncbi:prenylcysteine oxidase 1 isoform X2, partial [Clarias magur]